MTEKKVIETQYGWYQKNDDKVNVDEIIGIVKTDEQTNSVQLKKEAQLSICEKRLIGLEKENKELKQSNERLLKMLDNVANYMQRDNKYMPIDDFVEWWNNIATKGLDDGDVE